MRTYLVDGSNAVRRGGYDPRFPAVEEARVQDWLTRIDRLASSSANISIEVYFDGPRRSVGGSYPSLTVRFPIDGTADDMIIGSVRMLASSNHGAIVVTGDGGLAREAEGEGAKVLGFSEFEDRLRNRRC
jgi:hypothetical protein